MRPQQQTVRLRALPRSAAIFRKMVDRSTGGRGGPGGIEAGSVVRVVGRDGGFLGQAFWNPRSEIALRLLSRTEEPIVDDEWFQNMVRRAVSLRRDTLQLARVTDAYRVVHAEGDGLPGLIVDRYADVLACQVSSLGIYRRFAILRDALVEALGARTVHVTADQKLAKREGFPVPRGAGSSAATTIREHGLRFAVDCTRGHKTGFFLDQRDSRLRIRKLAEGRRVLDLFSYTGGFALNAARGKASHVTAVDLDEAAVAAGRENAALNELADAIRFEHADAFDVLRGTRPGQFDLMVVDPAKQAQSRGDAGRAVRYYADLNRLAFEKVARDGLVLTCSCTGMVDEAGFLGALDRAAFESGRHVAFLEIRGAPADHPVAANVQEGRYLKTVLCRVA